ncbi:MAG: hypothetical protein J0H69_08700 [Burkholderiales bacterium]|nr:hypothetical protein [Burkholderiales bacterium]
MLSVTSLEKQALDRALDGPQPWMPFLRAQAAVICVKDRRSTGVGQFVEFELPLGVSPVPEEFRDSIFAPSVQVIHPALPYGGSFILWIEDGFINTLECVANAAEWPLDDCAGNFTFE